MFLRIFGNMFVGCLEIYFLDLGNGVRIKGYEVFGLWVCTRVDFSEANRIFRESDGVRRYVNSYVNYFYGVSDLLYFIFYVILSVIVLIFIKF